MVDGATVVVGPGSLGADTTLTGSSAPPQGGLPRAGDLRGKVLELGPSGTKFTKPVMIGLPLPGAVPAGKQWSVAWLDTTLNQWVPLPTAIEGDRAISMVDHFTPFVLLESNAVDLGGSCSALPGCGGALGAHYDLSAACPKKAPPAAGELPFCPGSSTSQGEGRAAGTFDFDTQALSFTQTFTLGSFTRMELQPACLAVLPALVGGAITTCADVEVGLGAAFKAPMLCGGDVATKCVCRSPATFVELSQKGTYSTAGSEITTNGDGGVTKASYCVNGGNMHVTNYGDFDLVYAP